MNQENLAMKLPKKLTYCVSQGNAPVPGLMLKAIFKTLHKNHYSIVFGPTDENGKAMLDDKTITDEAAQQLQLSMMDYAPLENVFSGTVVVSVMGVDDLERALKAYELFGSVSKYPDGYIERLGNAIQLIRQMKVPKEGFSISSEVEN